MFSSPPPLAPPTTEEDALRWLRLVRSPRIGPTTFFRLIAEHGSVAAALDALPGVARASGVRDYAPCPAEWAEAELAAGRAAGARLICFGDPLYPHLLARIADPPPVLWAIGNPALTRRPAVAIVGARNASSLGLRTARALARGLGAAGCIAVSGLARGIDAACHLAALDTGTVAVVAGGVDVMYPPENAGLARDIAERGLILSEQPIGLEPQARHFPRRNRIVAGLSDAVVVVEAAAKSGSLITARMALEQGREVMAVPGHPFDARAGGCNILIRDGATLVRGVEDVLEVLGSRQAASCPSPPDIAVPPAHRGKGCATARDGRDRPGHDSDRAAPAAEVPGTASPPLRERGRPGRPGPRCPPGHGDRGETGARIPRGAPRAAPVVHQGREASPRAAGPGRATPHPPASGAATALGARILALLGPSPVAEDQILRDLGLPPQMAAEEILTLELEGRIERRPGGLLALAG